MKCRPPIPPHHTTRSEDHTPPLKEHHYRAMFRLLLAPSAASACLATAAVLRPPGPNPRRAGCDCDASPPSGGGGGRGPSLFPAGAMLARKSGALVDAREAVAGKHVLIYFSAHWCPPCRRFTPQLKAFYEEANAAKGKRQAPLEVVFVSSDETAEAAAAYVAGAHGDWLSVPFDSELRWAFKQRYGVWAGAEREILGTDGKRMGIPTLVLVVRRGGGAGPRRFASRRRAGRCCAVCNAKQQAPALVYMILGCLCAALAAPPSSVDAACLCASACAAARGGRAGRRHGRGAGLHGAGEGRGGLRGGWGLPGAGGAPLLGFGEEDHARYGRPVSAGNSHEHKLAALQGPVSAINSARPTSQGSALLVGSPESPHFRNSTHTTHPAPKCPTDQYKRSL